MHQNFLRLFILAMSLIYIFVIPKVWLSVKLFFKAIPMLLIIYYGIQQIKKTHRSAIHEFVMIGLVFSLVGDMTLTWFLVGLTAFLLGHVFYICGFAGKWHFSLRLSLAIIPIGAFSIWMGYHLLHALSDSGEQALKIPVIAYIAVIAIMCFLAVMTENKWAALGGVLFVISDAILAWNMFVRPLVYEGVFVMGTYYGGQFFIAHSLSLFNRRQRLQGYKTRASYK